jgi:membrane-associated protein
MPLLVLARFVPGGRIAFTMTAGIVGHPYRRFRNAVALAAPLWTAGAFGIGLIGGQTFRHNTFTALALGLAIAGGACVLIDVGRRVARRMRPDQATSDRHATRRQPHSGETGLVTPGRKPD